MNIVKIAFRNLNRQKRRSVLLIIAIAFAFFVVLLLDGMTAGAMKNVEVQISKLVGGHVFIMGAQKAPHVPNDEDGQFILTPEAQELIRQIAEQLKVDAFYTIMRARDDGKLIFEGKEARTQIDGCKFDEEKLLQDSIAFKEGSWEGMKQENAILLSEKTAQYLNVQLHDSVLLETKTFNGQLTVAELQVEGIFTDTSAFGGLSNYINFDYLNKIRQAPEGMIDLYSFFLKNADMQNPVAEGFEKLLGEHAPVTSRAVAQKLNPSNPATQLLRQLHDGKWQGTKFSVAAFYDFAPQVVTMMNTLKMISLGVLIVLLMITMIGVSNTFKMIVHERKGEIGTMRSCGVMKQSIKWLFISEASLLSFIGAMTGFVLAVVVMTALTVIPIGSSSALYVFTNNGYFSWILSPLAVVVKFVVMFVLTLLTVNGSASRAANMIPAEALRTGK